MPSGTSIKQMNVALYNASILLLEASKHMANVPEFRDEAAVLLLMAKKMSDIIQPEVRKVTEDRMLSIMDEISNFGGTQ